MKLKKLLKGIPTLQVKGSRDVEITGMTANSKVVSPGNLFIAKRGRTYDGFAFIPDAVASGATAVVTELYNPSLKKVTQVIVEDAGAVEGVLAARYYERPSSQLFTVGVTGTNGKTTTTYFVKAMFERQGFSCGMIGSVEYIVGGHHYHPTHTTPDVISNHRMLREMCLQQCRAAVMEVTSHALDQGRVNEIDFDVAIYTNLSHEHLDYHRTMEEYAAAKHKLFANLSPKAVAVVNGDCPWSDRVVGETQARKVVYGLVHEADLKGEHVVMDREGTALTLDWKGEKVRTRLPCIGEFNVYNALAAAAASLVRDVPLNEVAEQLSFLPPVPGRLEKVPNPGGYALFVDYAHTEDALRHALKALRPLCHGKLIVLFGCGGDRDKEKRPLMGRAAEELADRVIVTTDNPRKEDPQKIADEITAGMALGKHQVVLDRREAIQTGIDSMEEEDIFLIAGRGHERSQIFANQIFEFHDVAVAQELCQGRKG